MIRQCLILAALSLAFWCAPALPQECPPGELRVFVQDSQLTPVIDADIKLALNAKPAGERASAAAGGADFQKVPCGLISVTVAKDEFEPATKTIEMTAAAHLEITLTLTPKMQISSVEVTEKAPAVEQSASENNEIHPSEVKALPSNPATVTDALPLIPGVVRSQDGELKIEGNGENRSALVVNQTDVTDPATGRFGQTVPIDSIETINVLNTPFLAQYGRFTSGVVAVETKRGGDKWHADLNDPFPDFRIRSYHMRGIRNETPRGTLGGPLIANRLYFNTSLVYDFQRTSSRTLPFPFNESKEQSVNSFTQLDWIQSPKQIVTATLHISPQHANFVGLDFFHPQPTAPSYAQHNWVGTAADHFGIFGGILDSSLSFQRFDAKIGSQGSLDMDLTPTGYGGNFFGTQNRSARRTEWFENYSLRPLRLLGTHLVKTGTSTTWSGDDGQFTYRGVNILDGNGVLRERIDFSARSPFSRTDLEFIAYLQDHWSLNSRISFDYGVRVEHQRLPDSLRIAPRAGIAWSPFANERTVFRAGYGEFYDHLPLEIYTFGRYPQRTITQYAPDGSIIGTPEEFVNVIGSITGPRTFLVRGLQVAGGFSPRGATWNVQAEHRFSKLLQVRGLYTDNRSVGLVMFEAAKLGDQNEVVLNGDGRSRYRKAEVIGKMAWSDSQMLVFSYTRSRAEGNLNGFDTFLGNFPSPLLLPNVYSNLPADLPNRFLLWGRMKAPWGFTVLPTVEYRNGFPYSRFDATQNYVGTPNSDATRFPNFFSADARIMRDFKMSAKYTVRLSLTTFNITNHFNALAVHANSGDPQYGVFFGNYHRRYRGDFEFVF
jgi:hypothetical protein